MEARVEASQQKATEAEETHRVAEGAIMELRGSLGLLETMWDASYSELHGTRQLMVGVSFPLPSFPLLRGRVSCS